MREPRQMTAPNLPNLLDLFDSIMARRSVEVGDDRGPPMDEQESGSRSSDEEEAEVAPSMPPQGLSNATNGALCGSAHSPEALLGDAAALTALLDEAADLVVPIEIPFLGAVSPAVLLDAAAAEATAAALLDEAIAAALLEEAAETPAPFIGDGRPAVQAGDGAVFVPTEIPSTGAGSPATELAELAAATPSIVTVRGPPLRPVASELDDGPHEDVEDDEGDWLDEDSYDSEENESEEDDSEEDGFEEDESEEDDSGVDGDGSWVTYESGMDIGDEHIFDEEAFVREVLDGAVGQHRSFQHIDDGSAEEDKSEVDEDEDDESEVDEDEDDEIEVDEVEDDESEVDEVEEASLRGVHDGAVEPHESGEHADDGASEQDAFDDSNSLVKPLDRSLGGFGRSLLVSLTGSERGVRAVGSRECAWLAWLSWLPVSEGDVF